MKIPIIVLISVLTIALAISLTTIYRMDEKVSHMRELVGDYDQRVDHIASQRDTLVLINSAFAARIDSVPSLRHVADSLQIRLDEAELVRNYPGYYLIIDTGQNRFHLRRGGLLIRSGYCGTGKGWTENDSGLVWNFSTPRGIRYVVKKGENPYWYKPDWYWLEQNLRPPRPGQDILIPDSLSWEEQVVYYNDSLTSSERVWVRAVPGALGNFKVDLGGGILLHYGVGRGRNVSHGCIRLSNNDLEAIYRALPVGAPVLIY